MPPEVAVDVPAALRGDRGVEGIRELARAPLGNGLGGLLAQCATDAPADWSLQLLRTKYKPGRKLDACYRMPQSSGGRLISVTWRVLPTDPPPVAEIEADAESRGLLVPFRRLSATSDDGRVSLLVAPADPSMPRLVPTSDGLYVDAMLAGLASVDATARAFVKAGVAHVRAVRYRPGQRHVLRILGPGERTTAFLKLDRDDSGQRAVRVAGAIGMDRSELCPGVALVEPLGYSHPDRASVWAPAPGMTLWERARVAGPLVVAQLVRNLGRALRVLHESRVDKADALKALGEPVVDRSAEDEHRATSRAGEHIQALLPATGSSYCNVLAEVAGRLSRLPPEPPTFIHGDIKGENLAVDGYRMSLLDLDRCSWGDPALDLGKFLADIWWWCSRSRLDEAAISASFIHGYGSDPPSRWARARLIAVLFQLKLTARRGAVHDFAWATETSHAVQEAHARLSTERAS
jgi:aminoglycoside phosphotransferase (APT) family kinase protein